MARAYPHRRADSRAGRIRAVLASNPLRKWRASDVAKRLPDLPYQQVVETLHKMARRRQIVRVEVHGERFARWQA